MVQFLQKLVGELYRHTPSYVPRQALLVQQNKDRSDDVFSIEELLRRRGYQIRTVGVEQCTREHVLASVDQLVHDSRDDSKTFFYYAGHGEYSRIPGIHMNGSDTPSYLSSITPQPLFERLGKVKGKKAIVIDACLSGEFVDYIQYLQHLQNFFPKHLQDQGIGKPMIENYILMTATTEEGYSISSGITDTKGTPLEGRRISPLVYMIYNMCMKNREINLTNVPLPEFKITESTSRDYQEKYPEIDVQRIKLQIQRVSDTDFIL